MAYIAAQNGFVDVLKYLKSKGADLAQANKVSSALLQEHGSMLSRCLSVSLTARACVMLVWVCCGARVWCRAERGRWGLRTGRGNAAVGGGSGR